MRKHFYNVSLKIICSRFLLLLINSIMAATFFSSFHNRREFPSTVWKRNWIKNQDGTYYFYSLYCILILIDKLNFIILIPLHKLNIHFICDPSLYSKEQFHQLSRKRDAFKPFVVELCLAFTGCPLECLYCDM